MYQKNIFPSELILHCPSTGQCKECIIIHKNPQHYSQKSQQQKYSNFCTTSGGRINKYAANTKRKLQIKQKINSAEVTSPPFLHNRHLQNITA